MPRYVASKDLKDALGDLRIGMRRLVGSFAETDDPGEAEYLAKQMDIRMDELLHTIRIRRTARLAAPAGMPKRNIRPVSQHVPNAPSGM